ncbi:MAG: hypothetical protein PGN29_06405 [Gordonia paraffinivorans]
MTVSSVTVAKVPGTWNPRRALWPVIAAVVSAATAVCTFVAPSLTVFALGAVLGVAALVAIVRPAVALSSAMAPVLAALTVTVLNFFGALTSVPLGAYVPLVIVGIVVVLAARHLSSAYPLPSVLAVILCVLGIIGTLVGRIFFGISGGILPVVVPMLLVAAPLTFSDDVTAGAIRRWSRWASLGCTAVVALIGFAYLRPDVVSVGVINHEKSFLVLGAIGFALVGRSVLAGSAAIVATVFAFLEYPAATYGLVAAAAVIGLIAFVPRYRTPAGPVAVSVAITAATLLTAFNIEPLLGLRGQYFQTVGKVDNSTTRLQIYGDVFRAVRDPWFGSLFTNDVTVQAKLNGSLRVVPAHSDVLTMYLGGGLVAAVVFVMIFASATYAVMRARASLTGEQYAAAAVMITVALGGLAGGLVNPVLLNPTTSVVVVVCLLGGLSIARSGAGSPSSPRVPRKASRHAVPVGSRRRRPPVIAEATRATRHRHARADDAPTPQL